ncbi:hypothetical protein L917_05240 [Plasmopara halstedii]|uniref:CCHC-type domain-containing protein n=1 Tax=Plasmopara halstedii TaxID=4781 RepID=A0A0P1B047_PLAHL|nr:hypothetical protein L917_05240 [Plasmopara halstedii]CEG46593.1 hypothetical protein L917_05240 [Plasmopara halstedii]|eukprot:XP_024582962.1 hypothetical protein L917_05240 [Plasmopara halstedii]
MEANNIGTSVHVFDGSTDFRVWRARVENELMRYHLLGYVMVRGYDGSQSFTYNGEVVPPRVPMALEEGEQQQPSLKEEAPCDRNTTTQRGRLSRWDVLGESAEAKGILQRFLHPDVESAILNKNIYDSWMMLCTLYGNRSSPGAHNVYEMHRVLYHIRLGDKKEEPVTEFITRWEMLMQQYALATGIELTDAFRSISLTQTLPSAWIPMVSSWRGTRPFVPYVELVEKVVAIKEQMQAKVETSSVPSLASGKTSPSSTNNSTDAQTSQLVVKTAADMLAIVEPVEQGMKTPITEDMSVEKQTTTSSEKQRDELPEQCADETTRSSDNYARSGDRTSPLSDVTTGTGNTLDLRTGEISTSKRKRSTSPRSRSISKKRSSDRGEKYSGSRSYRDSKRSDSDYDKRHTHDRHNSERGYDNFERIDSNGPVSCFYCLKLGHHMKNCWYLKADIESGTTHESHKKYTCAVTLERNEFMVCCLEAYIDEVNRERAARRASKSTANTSRRSGYEIAESAERKYRPQQQELALPPPPGQPPIFAFRDQQQSSSSTTAADFHKRSRSVFQSAEGRISSRDPRLNRSNSVYRSTDVTEEFSSRKRGRTPSFERQLRAYY